MIRSKLAFSAIVFTTIFTVSCTKEAPQEQTTETINFTIPKDYTFERSGSTTVDFAGQTSRIMMLDEMGNYIKNAATNGTEASASVLSNMYSNKEKTFSSTELNDSGRQLKDKTATSRDYFSLLFGGGSSSEKINVQAFFETQLVNANLASKGAILASAGVAGVYTDGTSKRLFAPNGLEPQQVLLKGLMGACFMDQIVNHYLSLNRLDIENNNKQNNTNKVFESGKNYTAMEHFWDEAYGYVYGAGGGKYWDSYINQVNADTDFNTVKADIKNAFIKGRAAIVANDYKTRDAQIYIIKTKLALVPAVRAVYYLQEGKGKLTNGAAAFHALSEAYGFILSLRYTNKPGTNAPFLSKTDVDTILADLTAGKNGLWDVDYLNTKLDMLSTQIATKFGFTVAQAATVN